MSQVAFTETDERRSLRREVSKLAGGYGREFFDWITHDKGYARKLTDFGDVINPEGIRTIGEMPNLTAAMQKRGWKEARIRKVMGENWMRLLKEVWGA